MSSPASLPKEITRSAERGELQKVVKWLRKGGLVDALNACEPHFVRCLKPNAEKVPGLFDSCQVYEQMLRGGLMEAVEVGTLRRIEEVNGGIPRCYKTDAVQCDVPFERVEAMEHALSQQRRVDMPRVVESSVSSLPWVPDAVAAMYLLHPYRLLTSCALSTSVLCYAALALGLSWACQGVWRLGRWLAFGALGGGGTDVLYARAAVKPCVGVRGWLPEPVLPARHPWILVPPAALVSAAGTPSGMCMSPRRVPWCLSPLSASTVGPGMG